LLTRNENRNLLFMRKEEIINQEQRSAEPRRSQSSCDYCNRCRPRRRMDDQEKLFSLVIQKITKRSICSYPIAVL
jgi:hypothetical protein